MSNKLVRTITPEIRIIDVTAGIVDYVASDETLDAYKEIILASGWRFDQFRKNAPFVNSHDYSTIRQQLGKVTDFRVENGKLIERVQWAIDVEENELARLGWKMTVAGYLKAVSVGFVPSKWLTRWNAQDADAFNAQCGKLQQNPLEVDRIFTEHQQIELSACIIGANPNALACALSDGVITERSVLELFRKTPQGKSTASEPSQNGNGSAAPVSRSAEWFLAKLEKMTSK